MPLTAAKPEAKLTEDGRCRYSRLRFPLIAGVAIGRARSRAIEHVRRKIPRIAHVVVGGISLAEHRLGKPLSARKG
jgi:hypothetical protein